MSPRTSGRRRMFGKARKTVKIEGQKFTAVYSMSKVLVHEPPPPRELPPGSQPASLNEPRARVHGPYQREFDYAPFMPKKRNGRWVPGKWLPLIAKTDQKMCYIGYHACTMDKTHKWSNGYGGDRSRERIWLVEGVGPLEENPKSQKPLTTKIVYRMTRGRWVHGMYDGNGTYIAGHGIAKKRVRDKVAERLHNARVRTARDNGGHVYDLAADKYNFQSIRIIRPITDAPKREPKARKKAPTDWIRISGRRVKIYSRSGRIVPGQGVTRPRKR